MKIDLTQYRNEHSTENKMKRLVWDVVWGLFARMTPRWCLNGWRAALLQAFGAVLGSGVRVQGSVDVWQPWRLKIGDASWIDAGVKLYSVDEITIGSHAVISEGAFLCTASHDISSPVFELKTAPIEVGDNAWIGARAIILPGVKIGEGAVVAAGSVVTKNVEAWTVVGGNPAAFLHARVVAER